MPSTIPLPPLCQDILHEFHLQPINRGSSATDTPLMRAYREEIDLIEDYGLAEHYGCHPAKLFWSLIGAFAEAIGTTPAKSAS